MSGDFGGMLAVVNAEEDWMVSTGVPFPPRELVRDLRILPFFDRQNRTQRFNDLARGDQKHWEGPRVLSIWLIPHGPLLWQMCI
jgi:hypothetical protein